MAPFRTQFLARHDNHSANETCLKTNDTRGGQKPRGPTLCMY